MKNATQTNIYSCLSALSDSLAKTAVPAKNEALVINSHGSNIFGRLLLPARRQPEGTTAVVVLLHGYPGTEQNIDIAQSIRAYGMAAVHFSYRGVWGSHGEYSFSHIIEDTIEVISYIRNRAEEFHLNPTRIYLLGHSMGGFAAVNAIAQGLQVRGAILMAPCDMANKCLYDPPAFDSLLSHQQKGYFITRSSESLREDAMEHAAQWLFTTAAAKLDPGIQYGFIGGAEDKQTPPEIHILPLLRALKERNIDAPYAEICDSHTFPGTRKELTDLILSYLSSMESA